MPEAYTNTMLCKKKEVFPSLDFAGIVLIACVLISIRSAEHQCHEILPRFPRKMIFF